MRLSKHSKAVYESTTAAKPICKLIGQFARTDVSLSVGASYFEPWPMHGTSYLTPNWGGDAMVCYPMSTNDYINEFIIEAKTACSYIIRYTRTHVLTKCPTGYMLGFDYVFPELEGSQRVFPLRRVQYTENDQQLVRTFISIHEKSLVNLPKRYMDSNSFILVCEPVLDDIYMF